MDKQKKESRRKFLFTPVKVLPALAVAGTGIGQVTSALAQNRTGQGVTVEGYHPAYFQPQEWQFLLAACDRLIPAEEAGVGAIAANVPVFIDMQMQTTYGDGGLWYMEGPFHPDVVPELGYQLKFSPKELYRTGIADVNDHCAKQYEGRKFCEISEEEQISVLTDLESGKIELPNIPAKIFFQYLWANTKEGYLSDPMYGGNKDMSGWKTVGFPGARADFMDWVGQYNKPYPMGPVSIEGKRG